MKKVIVGSNNPVKLQATKEAFAEVFRKDAFEFVTFSAESGVPDQPFGAEETKIGAKNRADACKAEYPDADFYIGLEGGIEINKGEHWTSAWMCVQDNNGRYGYGRTGAFLLPSKVSELIDQGKELSDAIDAIFNETNIKHKEGAVGVLTGGVIVRKDLYKPALIFALIPFIKSNLYS